jgi:hypothetical protein
MRYALRLQSSILEELMKVAEEEGTSINQFINVAVAEKSAVLRTVKYFKDRAAQAEMETFRRFLESGGGAEPPREEDDLAVTT